MKTRNLLLALGCAAAFTACTNNDEPAVAPATRTVTLSVEVAEPADTRVAYTEEGTTYKFKWTGDDELFVYYSEGGTEKIATFEIDECEGNQATFTGSLPSSVTQVTISNRKMMSSTFEEGKLVPVNVQYSNNVDDEFTVARLLEDATFLYAENVAVTDGNLPNVKLQHAVAYLLLRKGLQVVDANITDTYRYSYGVGNYQQLSFSSTGITKEKIPVDFDINCTISDGKLEKDVLLSFYVDKAGEELELPFAIVNAEFEKIGTATQPKHAYKPGVIYEVAADNTNWVAVTSE